MKFSYTTKASHDLNTLLIIANVLICVITAYLYFTRDNFEYVDFITVFITYLFAIENIGMLSYEKRRRNPFILILVLVGTFFYMMRIPSLIWIPSSAITFELLSIKATDLNYSLSFILLANASMFLGFHLGTKHKIHHTNLSFSKDANPKVKNALILISIVILTNYFNVLNQEIFGRLSGFISQILFNPHIIILFTFTMLAYHYEKISQQVLIIFIIIFFCVIVLITLSGSRSALLTLGMLLLFSILAAKQKFMISNKLLLLFLILIPISLIFFVSSTYKRQANIQTKITVEHIYLAYDAGMFDLDKMEPYWDIIFYRIGFLDYSTEIIANRQRFSAILNREYYIKSIIDNALTPGLDVFGVPRVSHSISYIRRGESVPSRDEITASYQSDQLGIYGEYYGIFYGYAALIIFFFLAFIFQKIYITFKTTNILLFSQYRSVLLLLFYNLLNSFGMDWFLLDIITAVITSLLFARFYDSGRRRKFVLRPESEKNLGIYDYA